MVSATFMLKSKEEKIVLLYKNMDGSFSLITDIDFGKHPFARGDSMAIARAINEITVKLNENNPEPSNMIYLNVVAPFLSVGELETILKFARIESENTTAKEKLHILDALSPDERDNRYLIEIMCTEKDNQYNIILDGSGVPLMLMNLSYDDLFDVLCEKFKELNKKGIHDVVVNSLHSKMTGVELNSLLTRVKQQVETEITLVKSNE